MKSWREFTGHTNNIWEKFQDKYCRKQLLMVIKIPKYQPLFVRPKALLPLFTKHSSLPQLHLVTQLSYLNSVSLFICWNRYISLAPATSSLLLMGWIDSGFSIYVNHVFLFCGRKGLHPWQGSSYLTEERLQF